MREAQIINLLLQGNQLKRTARTGWVQRGVAQAEDVAAHSYGVSFTALVLAQLIDQSLDVGRMLAMAILHDLPEGLTTDIPTPAWRFLPPGIKEDVERQAMKEILAETSAAALLPLWEELQENRSMEAQLVHDADKLDLYLQALVYERQTGNGQLAEFWQKMPAFHFPLSQKLYHAIRQQRPGRQDN